MIRRRPRNPKPILMRDGDSSRIRPQKQVRLQTQSDSADEEAAVPQDAANIVGVDAPEEGGPLDHDIIATSGAESDGVIAEGEEDGGVRKYDGVEEIQ